MQITEINPLALPSLPLKERSLLPATSCIYFAIDCQGVVQYIGRSLNLQQRWMQHHRQSDLEKVDGVQIAWLAIDTPELLPEIERALIEWFSPPLNDHRDSSESKTRILVTIPETVAEQFKEFCKKQRRSVSAQITLLMEQAMQQEVEEVSK